MGSKLWFAMVALVPLPMTGAWAQEVQRSALHNYRVVTGDGPDESDETMRR